MLVYWTNEPILWHIMFCTDRKLSILNRRLLHGPETVQWLCKIKGIGCNCVFCFDKPIMQSLRWRVDILYRKCSYVHILDIFPILVILTRVVACFIFWTIPLWPRYCRDSQRGNARSFSTGWLEVKPAARDWETQYRDAEQWGSCTNIIPKTPLDHQKMSQKWSQYALFQFLWKWCQPTSAGSSCL